jgi:hypothetical protein
MDLIPDKESPKQDDEVFSYKRSIRSVGQRVMSTIAQDMQSVKEQDISMIRKMNDAIARLDAANADKRMLSQQLVEKIKFVRALQA